MVANVEPEKTHVVFELKHGKPLIACRFDPIGHYVFSASEDETIERWDLNAASASPAAQAGDLRRPMTDGVSRWRYHRTAGHS